MNLLDNTPNQLLKLRSKKLFEKNDDASGIKTDMLKSSLCDYSEVYILVK